VEGYGRFGCPWGRHAGRVPVLLEEGSPVVCTELDAGLLQYEPVYPGVEHSEDEHCCSPDPGISPSS
jgi:hypothetical protein